MGLVVWCWVERKDLRFECLVDRLVNFLDGMSERQNGAATSRLNTRSAFPSSPALQKSSSRLLGYHCIGLPKSSISDLLGCQKVQLAKKRLLLELHRLARLLLLFMLNEMCLRALTTFLHLYCIYRSHKTWNLHLRWRKFDPLHARSCAIINIWGQRVEDCNLIQDFQVNTTDVVVQVHSGCMAACMESVNLFSVYEEKKDCNRSFQTIETHKWSLIVQMIIS
jgi:hypothetical protein